MSSTELSWSKEPLQRFKILQNAGVDSLADSSGQWFTPSQIRPVRHDVGTKGIRTSVSASALGPLKLVYAKTTGSGLFVNSTHQMSDYVITFAIGGTNRIAVNETEISCTDQRAVILSPHMAANMQLSDGYEQLHIRIERTALEKHLERMLGSSITKPLQFELSMDLVDPLLASWVRGLRLLVFELDQPLSLSTIPIEHNPWSDFLMKGLLLAQPHNYSRELAPTSPKPFRPQSLQRALDLIEQHPARDLSLAQLCAAAEIGPRSLQRYFRKYVGNSTTEYVKWVRLSRAHEDLQRGADETVTEIAFRWGFTHVPRFAAAYHDRYGMLPSETLTSAKMHVR